MAPGVAELEVLLAVNGEEGHELEAQAGAPDGKVVAVRVEGLHGEVVKNFSGP